ncbi:MAG TPA: alpha/beta hydrolase [Asticcacaulis sp.]|nr:alpha/beta hydrolase [Asticcacaulis sp.]
MFDRRMLLGLAAITAAMPGLAKAQKQADAKATSGEGSPGASVPSAALKPQLPIQNIWPGAAPGGEKVTAQAATVLRGNGKDPNDTAFTHIHDPWMTMAKPAKPNGGAVLIAPGGAYIRVAVSKSKDDMDTWLTDLGYHVFKLGYRLPGDGWAAGPDVALQDVQRAVRVIRSRAQELGLDANRVAVMGFSAGGHVAGLSATRFADAAYTPVDDIDKLSARPVAVLMGYPVVTATLPYAHVGSINELIGKTPTDEQRQHASIELHVPADAPPTFCCATTDDPVVPPRNAILMYLALKDKKIASELHMYEGNTHGFPLHNRDGQLNPWAVEGLTFLERHGLAAKV